MFAFPGPAGGPSVEIFGETEASPILELFPKLSFFGFLPLETRVVFPQPSFPSPITDPSGKALMARNQTLKKEVIEEVEE